LGASGQDALRSAGQASTSYGVAGEGSPLLLMARRMSGKGGKGKGVAAKAATPPPTPTAAAVSQNPAMLSAGARLRRKSPTVDPLSLLNPQQRALAEMLVQRSATPEAVDRGGSAEGGLDGAAVPEDMALRGLGQLGLPLGRREVASLLSQSLSNAVGGTQQVHFQPFVFSNIFQSAPAAASYVAAALESGGQWNRVERFFLAAVEGEGGGSGLVRGVRVQVRGRIGRKAEMAEKKIWQWGDIHLKDMSDRLDYGTAAANTRVGVLGVKVWIRYKRSAIKDLFFPPGGGSHHRAAVALGATPSLALGELFQAAAERTSRVALPNRFSSVAWWERPATAQPPENRAWEVFTHDFKPEAGERLDAYLRRSREGQRRFRTLAERRAYMATTGRFLAKQRRMLATPASDGHAAGGQVTGRRVERVLARYSLAAYVPRHRRGIRYGVLLPPGACHHTATASLSAASPPSLRSIAVLYGPLGYNGAVPPTAGAAQLLIQSVSQARPYQHPLDSDLAPVALSQVNELCERLGYIGRAPFSYSSAQVVASMMRIVIADADDEARLRPLRGMDGRQAQLIRYLRSRAAPPGTRGTQAVLEVDLEAAAQGGQGGAGRGISRLAAARNILQLLQNHELCTFPRGEPVERLRALGLAGPVPPTTGEALMLAEELRDRCLPTTGQQLAALHILGYDGPAPESVAHVRAVLRVLRRADTEAATPSTRAALGLFTELRRRAPAPPSAVAAAVAGVEDGSGLAQCPSQLEVRVAIDQLPPTEQLLGRLINLGWPGPMPVTHGTAVALEEYLMRQRTSVASTPPTSPTASPYSTSTTRVPSINGSSGGPATPGVHRRPGPFTSKLGSSPDAVLAKLQIRGLFPGAVSEWHLGHMCSAEAAHVLASLVAARGVVVARVRGGAYDEFVERWEAADAEGDWWGMEFLWD
ncbi:30S ribosomal protein S3, partial [Tetrabaena socialis]